VSYYCKRELVLGWANRPKRFTAKSLCWIRGGSTVRGPFQQSNNYREGGGGGGFSKGGSRNLPGKKKNLAAGSSSLIGEGVVKGGRMKTVLSKKRVEFIKIELDFSQSERGFFGPWVTPCP